MRTGSLEYRCPYCDGFQGSPYNLREHISKNHTDKRYPQWLMTSKEFLGFMALDNKEEQSERKPE